MTNPPPVPPDTKDWTWTLTRRCEDCGLDASAVPALDLARLIDESAIGWDAVLARPDVAVRPAPQVWSPLEYACHVRDVHALFAGRVAQMLAEEEPTFAGWDQDVAAVEGRYHAADPGRVLADLTAHAGTAAAAYAAVPAEGWDRVGRRGDGAAFTVTTLGRYHLHDVVHHLHDVR